MLKTEKPVNGKELTKNENFLHRARRMSNLSATLSKMLDEKSMTAAELSRITGIDDATISRWKNGKQTSIPSNDLHAIAKAITSDPTEQARLTLARMQDLCKGPGAQFIDIQIKQRSQVREESGKHESWPPMTPKFERCLRILANYSDQTEVRDIVVGLADILEPATPTRPKRRPVLEKSEKN